VPEAVSNPARDERLAALFEEVSQQIHQGQRPDFDAISSRHPDLVDELRQLLAVANLVEEVRRSSTGSSVAHAGPVYSPSLPAPASLPRTFGDYELQEELGRGGMGVVYKAWDKSLQRHVALKMVLRGEHASAADLSRFRGEARSAAGLSHPNIVPVYNVGEHDGQAFFSMKYIEGETLARRVRGGPLPPREAARILAQAARAVDHAHQNGILHRDLKPANVLLDDTGQPHVTDFGLAKRVEGGVSLTGTGAIVGTPSYMAPEQAAGSPEPPTSASDVYSLGAILYEMLTGRPPFLAASAIDTLLLVRSEEPVRPRLLNPQIDPDLELIVRKCLEKRPRHRYASAAQLADDLDAFLSGEPVSARSSSLVYFVSRLFRETHHAEVLENWGVLWMWHSLKLFLLCAVTAWMHWAGVDSHLPYLALWSVGLIVWGMIFWSWRRRGGPVTFVERQLAHAWGAGVAGTIGIFLVEVLLGLPTLSLSPMLAVAAGMVFVVKAGTLSGWFYVAATAFFLAALPMTVLDEGWGLLLFGLVSALSFFMPGLKYYRQRLQANPSSEQDRN
jgi:serine/threonine protein kinase